MAPAPAQAPAAFGLVSFLMHAGLERNRIRKHLLVFALAAPVLAMLTFLGLSQVGAAHLDLVPVYPPRPGPGLPS